MNYFEIKYALAKKGYTLTGLAHELGLAGPQSVQQVLTRKHRSARVEKRVFEITGIPLEELFPDRYPSDKGQPCDGDENASEENYDDDRR